MSKTTPFAAALLAALLLAPSGAAGWLSGEPLTVSIPHLREGDLLLFTETEASPCAPPPGAVIETRP